MAAVGCSLPQWTGRSVGVRAKLRYDLPAWSQVRYDACYEPFRRLARNSWEKRAQKDGWDGFHSAVNCKLHIDPGHSWPFLAGYAPVGAVRHIGS